MKYSLILFILFLFSGADRISLNLGMLHLRFEQILVLLFGIYFIAKNKLSLNKNQTIIFILFIFSSIISLHNYMEVKSIIFIFYFLFNYILLFGIVVFLVKKFSYVFVVELYLKSFFIISILVIIQFILGQLNITEPIFAAHYPWGIKRPALWFYEPSYLAIVLILYFSLVYYFFLNKNLLIKQIKKHLFISVFAIIASTSSTAYLGMLFSFSFLTFLSNKVRFSKKLFLFISIIFSFIILFIILNNLSNGLVEKQLFRMDVDNLEQLNAVTGGRVEGWFRLIDVLNKNIFFGLGGGNYYLKYGSVATNVTLELFVELGIVGTTLFLIFLNYPIFYYFINKKKYFIDERYIIDGMILSLFITLIFLQTNQNYMRIYIWLHYAIISAFILSKKRRI